MDKILRVNMYNMSTSLEDVPENIALFGGRGAVAKILSEEVDPASDPLGPDNKLVLCPGLFADTAAPCSGRISIGAKSPLTGTVKEANAGGTAAKKMAVLNLYAVIIEGQPSPNDWWILSINETGADLLPAQKYLGMNTYELSESLRQNFGYDSSLLCIGQAGEREYLISSVQITDPEGRPVRAAARGGLGAVMGSKRIKAVVLNCETKAQWAYANKDSFLDNSRAYAKGILANPISGQSMPALGTAVLVNLTNHMGVLPTHNFTYGNFENAELISGEHIAEIQATRGGKNNHACHPGCVIKCSNVFNDDKGNYLTAGFEYETIALMGSNCGISAIDLIATLDRMCDELGVDTMDTGCTIAVAMEAGKLQFGDAHGAIALIQEMIDGTKFGRLLGQGTERVGKFLGVRRIPTVKGQAIAAYDPRGLKGTGVTYATSPMGADHTCGNSLGHPAVEPAQKDGQVEVSTQLQVGMALFDNLGMCIFSGFCTEDPENLQFLVNMFASKFGGQWDVDKLMGIAVQTLKLEKEFNKGAGFTEADNRLPQFFYEQNLDTVNTVFDITDEELRDAIPF